MFFAIMGAIGQFETELRRERQMEGIAKAKAEGAYKGRRRQDLMRFRPSVSKASAPRPLPGSSDAAGRRSIARSLGSGAGRGRSST